MAPARESFSFTASDGIILRGERWGDGPRPLVFSPGTGLPVETYVPALAGTLPGVTVHALGTRGHGRSEVPHQGADWEPAKADLRKFVAETFPEPPIVAGHSLGALLSLWLAADHPGLVAGLLLLDPVFYEGSAEIPPPGAAKLFADFLARSKTRRHRWPSRADAEEKLRGRGGYAGWAEAPFQAFLDFGLKEERQGSGVTLSCPPWLETAFYEKRPSQPIWDWIRRCRVPAVIVRGRQSRVAASHAIEELADAIPIATVMTVKGEHTFAQEHPAETAEVLRFAWAILERETATGCSAR